MLLNVVVVGAGDALLGVAILPGTQDNKWSLCSSENFATIRTITGRIWCGFTMVKAAFFCNELGEEKVHAQQSHHTVMAMGGSRC